MAVITGLSVVWIGTNEEAKSGGSGNRSDQMWGSGLVEAKYGVLAEVWEDPMSSCATYGVVG